MPDVSDLNPAERASKEALDRITNCIERHKSFVLEAGAGAGKTYSLIHALRYLIKTQGRELLRRNQKIACITYTNVAKDEIKKRTDGHNAILSETIHSFCWSLLKDFQPNLRAVLPSIGKWPERLNDTVIGTKPIKYDLGYPKVEEHEILLGHDDVLFLMVKLMDEPKFRSIFVKRYPILFIDEYQDTDKSFAESLKNNFLGKSEAPLIGFFGDHWQKIYGTGCGKIEHASLENIGKRANFRSERKIVECLNRMRPALTQELKELNSVGSVEIFHTNDWQGTRRTEGHWKDDLPADVAHRFLVEVRTRLAANEWDFTPIKTKILMLTHNVLAEEQGYRKLADVFSRTESYIKKEDDHISFFLDTLEPVCEAYESRRFGEMFTVLGNSASIRRHADKVRWADDMNTLLALRNSGTIGQVIDHLKTTKRPRLSEKVERKESKFSTLVENQDAELSEEDSKFVERLQKLKAVHYPEVIALAKFIDEKTPFSTKHGVKGAEFENVLVVIGRGWNQYNFGQMLEWAGSEIPAGKQETFERNRNLFYVACSRPQKRLALLFTQKLSEGALATLSNWFGTNAIHALNRASYA